MHVSNRTKEKIKELEDIGIKILDFQESLNKTDTIILVLTDYKAIEEHLLKNRKLLLGKNIIQMGTILPDESKYLSLEISYYGGNYIEAPVLGSGREAEIGKLIIMASGSKYIYEKTNILLSHLGQIHYLGEEIGKASALKLALNQLIASLTASFSYSLSIILKEKIDFNIFMDILRDSALYAPTFDKKLSKMIENDFSTANCPLKHLLKDVQLVKKLGETLDLNNEIINSIEKVLEKGVNLNYSDEDYSAIFKVIKNEI
jgi:3-hydroxyisobutyrate dehydrogenase